MDNRKVTVRVDNCHLYLAQIPDLTNFLLARLINVTNSFDRKYKGEKIDC